MSIFGDIAIWYFFGSYVAMAVILFTTRKATREMLKNFGPEEVQGIYGFLMVLMWILSPISLIAATKLKIKSG